MTPKLKPMSEATKALWAKAAWTVQQAQEKFAEAYEASLTELGGKHWRTEWRNWTNLDAVIEHLEDQIKTICMASGMKLTVFNRYRTGARKYCFHDVPMKFGINYTIPEVKEAQKLMDTYTSGDTEQRMERAYKEIRARRNLRSAKAVVRKSSATILPQPKGDVKPAEYRAELIKLIGEHLEAVKPYLKGNDATARLLRDVQAALKPQRMKAVA